MSKCQCKLCGIGREIDRITKQYKLSKKDSWLLLDTFWGNMEDAEMDRDYYKCILDGSWPHSVERLEFALAKAKSKREKENENSIK